MVRMVVSVWPSVGMRSVAVDPTSDTIEPPALGGWCQKVGERVRDEQGLRVDVQKLLLSLSLSQAHSHSVLDYLHYIQHSIYITSSSHYPIQLTLFSIYNAGLSWLTVQS